MYVALDPCIGYQYLSLSRIQISPLVVSHTMHLSFKYNSTLLGRAFFAARLFLHTISHIFVGKQE